MKRGHRVRARITAYSDHLDGGNAGDEVGYSDIGLSDEWSAVGEEYHTRKERGSNEMDTDGDENLAPEAGSGKGAGRSQAEEAQGSGMDTDALSLYGRLQETFHNLRSKVIGDQQRQSIQRRPSYYESPAEALRTDESRSFDAMQTL